MYRSHCVNWQQKHFLWSPCNEAVFAKVKQLVVQKSSSWNHFAMRYQRERTWGYFNSEWTASHIRLPKEKNYAQIEKERLAIVFGCHCFDQYFAGKDKVTVESDHKPLQSILKKPIRVAPCRFQRMLLRLICCNLDVQYKKGSHMFIADHFTRTPVWQEQPTEKLDEVQIFTMVTSSQIGEEFQAYKPKRPLQTHEIPDRLWCLVAADLFTNGVASRSSTWGELLECRPPPWGYTVHVPAVRCVNLGSLGACFPWNVWTFGSLKWHFTHPDCTFEQYW